MSALIEPRAVDAGHHVVQFYASDAELIASAGAYLRDGAAAGAADLVIATEAHRAAFVGHLRDAGVDVTAARTDGTLVLLDAPATLARFQGDDGVDRARFLDVVGGVVRAAAATGRPVRAYGEMVSLQWEAGDVMAAIELETLWNELGLEVPFSLYCAYRKEWVSGHECADALEQVCHLHSAVVAAAPSELTWDFTADQSAPVTARRLVTDALRRAGTDGRLLQDARLVVTELAANAIRHARSPFSVSLRAERSTIRILVRDGSHVMPEPRDASATARSGRGLRLVAEVASRWGVDVAPDGKTVWAELPR